MNRLARVVIGSIDVRDRVRQRPGNLDKLKQSISEVGLLQPIVVDDDHRLVSGWRRLRAAIDLEWDDIPAYVISSLGDARLRLIAERDENTCREEMNGLELTQLAKQLLEIEAPKAKQRQREGGKTAGRSRPKKGSETVSEPFDGEALQHVAEAIGVSAPSMRKSMAALDIYEASPEKHEDIKEALEAKQWTKAARLADGESPKPKAARKPKPFNADQAIHRIVHAIRTAVADWPKSEPLDELVTTLRHEAERISDRRQQRASA